MERMMNFLMKSLKWVTIIFVGIPAFFLILSFLFQDPFLSYYLRSFWNYFVLYLLAFYVYMSGSIIFIHYFSRKPAFLKIFPLFFLALVCVGEWISMKIMTADGDYGHPFGVGAFFIPLVFGHLLVVSLMAMVEVLFFKIKKKALSKKIL
jgi:hypothetical protein